jgi:Uma2 family endonuclease
MDHDPNARRALEELMSSLPQIRFTAAEYLARERAAETRSEFFDGEIFRVPTAGGWAGASRKHNLITTNLTRELSTALKGRPCETYVSDMRVKVSSTGLYTYPDVVVVCGEPQFEDEQIDTLLNPTLIIEVLSPTTEEYNRVEKFAHYRRIESLCGYVLIAQNYCHVEHYARQPENQWLLTDTSDPAAILPLPSIDVRLALTEIYDRVPPT